MPFDFLALDASARTYDLDGRMRVRVSHISKACVSPYRGSEIPNAEALGLQPDRIYQLLRDPDELARSVSTWNGIQLLIKHTPVSAENPQHDKVVGALGTDAAFRDPYLDNSLSVWDGDAIALIESGEQRQLSGGYHYTPDMTPGMFEGKSYDGVMRNIRANHVSLVKAGRAGTDVMVMDAAFNEGDHPRGEGGKFAANAAGAAAGAAHHASEARKHSGSPKVAQAHLKAEQRFNDALMHYNAGRQVAGNSSHYQATAHGIRAHSLSGTAPTAAPPAAARPTPTAAPPAAARAAPVGKMMASSPEGAGIPESTLRAPVKTSGSMVPSEHATLAEAQSRAAAHKAAGHSETKIFQKGNRFRVHPSGKPPGANDEAMSVVNKRRTSMPKKAATLSLRNGVALGALQVYLPSKLAKGQAMPDLSRLIAGAKSGAVIADRVSRAVQGRLAQDADLEDLGRIIDALKGGEEVDVAGQPIDPPGDPDAPPAAPAPGDPPVAPAPGDPPVSDPLEAAPPDEDAEDDDLEAKVRELLAGKLDDADLEMLIKLIQPEPADPAPASPDNPPEPADPQAAAAAPPTMPPKDDDSEDSSLPRPGGRDALPANLKENQVDKPAMDAAIRAAVERTEAKQKLAAEQAVADAIARTTKKLNARDDATRFVRPWIGEIAMAMDTAEDVYRLALETLNVPTKDVPPAAFRAMLALVPKPGEAPSRPRMAADAAITSGLIERFPALKNARVAG